MITQGACTNHEHAERLGEAVPVGQPTGEFVRRACTDTIFTIMDGLIDVSRGVRGGSPRM